ncbi:MAG: ribokinase [Actinomycetia bacterium]|nr:ribokinase [Actinomycetes bacterium]
MNHVVVVGSMNIDHVVRVERLPRPGETVAGDAYFRTLGGKGLNQAVAAARQGATVTMVGAVGTDADGDEVLAALDVEGIDRRWVRRVERPTGRAHITVDAAGSNVIVVVAGANAEATCPPEAVAGADVVLAQLEVPLATVIDAFAAARVIGARTVLNPAPARELPAELLALSDVLVPNETEAEGLVFAGDLLVTVGERGAELRRADGTTLRLPAPVVVVADTTAAGDALCGCLATGLATGLSLEDATRRAVVAGSLACTVTGAVPSLPSLDEVSRLFPAV